MKMHKCEKKILNPITIEKWEKYCENLLTENRLEYRDVNLEEQDTKNQNIQYITIEVEAALKNMKINKAAGPADLSIELIKHATTQTVEIICKIINKCLDEGNIPQTLENFIYKLSLLKKKQEIMSESQSNNYNTINGETRCENIKNKN